MWASVYFVYSQNACFIFPWASALYHCHCLTHSMCFHIFGNCLFEMPSSCKESHMKFDLSLVNSFHRLQLDENSSSQNSSKFNYSLISVTLTEKLWLHNVTFATNINNFIDKTERNQLHPWPKQKKRIFDKNWRLFNFAFRYSLQRELYCRYKSRRCARGNSSRSAYLRHFRRWIPLAKHCVGLFQHLPSSHA